MAKGSFTFNEKGLDQMRFLWEESLDKFNERLLVHAQELAPVSKDRGSRTGGSRGKTVTVELTAEGPRLAKGSHGSASASRYIKTKSLDELKPIKGRPGLYTYTFKRHRPGTLRRSGRVIEATHLQGGIEFTAPYAFFVEKGTRKMSARPFMLPALSDFRAEIESGEILKG